MGKTLIGSLNLASGFVGEKEVQSIWLGNNKIYEKSITPTGIHCVVSGLGSSSPSSVTFTKDTDFTKAGLGIEEITYNGDTFVKIPKMYRKVNSVSSNQITSFTISTAKEDNDFVPYSCFIDENGNELDYILIGKYWNTSSNSMVSTSTSSAKTMTTANARTLARNRGTGYQLYDWQMQKLWQDLIICLKGTIDTNSGTAWTYDELGIYWTTSGGWVDGVIGSSGTWYVAKKPSEYASSSGSGSTPSGYTSISYSKPTSGGEITKLGYDSNNPFFNYPSAVVTNTSYDTYYCDAYGKTSDNYKHPVYTCPGEPDKQIGVFYCSLSNFWSDSGKARLCYRPISS